MANIQGTKQPEHLTGTEFADHINGKDGGDIIFGGGGNDQIDGGKDIDFAIYQGNFADYTLTYTGHRDGHGADDTHLTIADHVASRDGIDTLKNVEFLHFNDANFDVGLNVTHFAAHDVNSFAVKPPGNEMYFGDGNTPHNYNVAELNEQDIELGLKNHYRTGNDITPTGVDLDGTVHYNAPSGSQVVDPAHGVSSANGGRAAWAFDYVVDTGVNGSSHTLADFNFKIVFTEAAGDHAGASGTFTLDPATHLWTNAANATFFGGDDFHSPASADVVSKVSENSQNLAFAPFTSLFGTLDHSAAAGTVYDIQLEAFSNATHGHPSTLLGSVHDIVTLV